MIRRGALGALGALVIACAHADSRPTAAPTSAPSVDEPAPLSDCNVMRLVALRDDDGGITRLLVEVTRDGEPALMIFDTGASTSCLTHVAATGSGRVRDGGKVRIFCSERTLPSEPKASLDPPHHGLPVVGNLGNDLLDEGPIEIDARKQTFALRPTGVASASSWVRVPLAIASGIPVTDASIDGTTYRMEIDTGGYRTFLFDANADMSPPVSITYDWSGNEVVMKESTGVLRFGDAAPRRVVLDRSRRYPVFEGWMRSTGIVGNIGIASLGSDRFVFDAARGELRIEPSTLVRRDAAATPATSTSAPVPPPATPSDRVCNGGVRAGTATCTAGPGETRSGEWLTYCTATGGGAVRCSSRPNAPICVAANVDGVDRAACCPRGTTDPTAAGCVTR